MTINDSKLTGSNIINMTDSLNAPLLELKINNNSSTIIPLSDNLIIYVDKDDTITEDRKQFVFTLSGPLKYYNNVSDEFIIKTYFNNNEVSMKSYVTRKIGQTGENLYILQNEITEEIEYQSITLFEGENYVYTNYGDANVELVYPKNDDINNRFLSNSIFNEHLKNTNELSMDDIYFKDAFTQTENGINIEVNNINTNCITSKLNKFSLDSDGNLSVNSITSVEEIVPELDYNEIFDLVYPVGSIYISVNSTNPSTFFYGSWSSFGTGRTMVGIDTSQTEFNTVEKTGGHKDTQSHTHVQDAHNHGGTTNNDGNHTHTTKYRALYASEDTYNAASNLGGSTTTALINSSGSHTHAFTTNNTTAVNQSYGNGDSGNLQPYITVYMWKRIS